MSDKKYKKVTGIGGVFFKCNDPEKIKEWYKKNLGLVTNEYESVFEFRRIEMPEKKDILSGVRSRKTVPVSSHRKRNL